MVGPILEMLDLVAEVKFDRRAAHVRMEHAGMRKVGLTR